MPFDLKGLREADWQPREATVEVPGLRRLFLPEGKARAKAEKALDALENSELIIDLDGEEKRFASLAEKARFAERYAVKKLNAVWRVRGLTDSELQTCEENVTGRRNKAVEAFTEALTGRASTEIIDAYSMDEDIPANAALRLEHVAVGSVEPPISYADAVTLGKSFPVELRMIAQEIVRLSGLGAIDKKKLQPSGETIKSD